MYPLTYYTKGFKILPPNYAMQSTFQFIFGHPDIGAGDAMANMAMAMAGIWKAHQPVIPGHHNQ